MAPVTPPVNPAVIDFDYLSAFNFQWECSLCGAMDYAFGPYQVYRDATTHRKACHDPL